MDQLNDQCWTGYQLYGAKHGEVEGVGSWGAYEDEWHTDGTDQYYGDYGDYGENESDPGYA